jgi:hypothetical protein
MNELKLRKLDGPRGLKSKNWDAKPAAAAATNDEKTGSSTRGQHRRSSPEREAKSNTRDSGRTGGGDGSGRYGRSRDDTVARQGPPRRSRSRDRRKKSRSRSVSPYVVAMQKWNKVNSWVFFAALPFIEAHLFWNANHWTYFQL